MKYPAWQSAIELESGMRIIRGRPIQTEDHMATLSDIRSQIEQLQRQEREIIANEKKSVIAQIRQQIAEYGISSADLGFPAGDGAARGRKARSAPAPVKYRRGDDTWSGGRGRKPQWVQEVLAAGESIETYRVE
jgi:DNA-binding protein H-NS